MIKTKITCTIGPASWDKKTLKSMIKHGMTIARFNGAYADTDEGAKFAKLIRSISKDVALMFDIKGTEVRLNKFEEPLDVKKGQKIIIGSTKEDEVYPITYPDLYKDLKAGDILQLDDGRVKLEVENIENKKIYCKVIYGEKIFPGKTINTPGIPLNNPPITKRDIKQIKFAVEDGWDFIAASFVRHAEDILEVKKYTKGSDIKIIAKVEDEQGVRNIDEIIDVADGVIIARGDMAVEMPFENIPIIQKEMIAKCLIKAKPVIVATQMLDSMKKNNFPTRAEISDVSNAVLDGTDCIWLSGETATGKYPALSVEVLEKISKKAEQYVLPAILPTKLDDDPITVSVAKGVIDICEELPIKSIVVATGTGKTARVISSFKPEQPIIALTYKEIYKRQLQMTWGVVPLTCEKQEDGDRDKGIKKIVQKVIDEGLVGKQDMIVVVRGTNITKGYSNAIEVGIAGDMI